MRKKYYCYSMAKRSRHEVLIKRIADSIDSCQSLLSHYTTFESACLILESKKIKYSNPLRVNDINESSRTIFTNPKMLEYYDDIVERISHYRQISLTQNGKRMCYDIPAMWGHYADKGNGVCLLFDKKAFLSKLSDKEWSGRIRYVEYSSQDIVLNRSIDELPSEIESNKQSIFFEKTKDWSYEQEYRIIKCFDSKEDEYLEIIPNALLAIILCSRYSPDAIDPITHIHERILSNISNAPILFYEQQLLQGTYGLKYQDEKGKSHFYSDRNCDTINRHIDLD